MLQDIRFAMRTLARNPGFAAAAILVLAIGIGANSAIFSAVYAVLLRPLPFPESDRLVWLWAQDLKRNVPFHFYLYPDFAQWREMQRSFESMTAYAPGSMALVPEGAGEPERVSVMSVNAEFFKVFRMTPRLGRPFSREDDTPGAPRVAILSDRLWRSRFGSDPNLIGRAIRLDGQDWTVAGIVRDFRIGAANPDILLPIARPATRGDQRSFLPVGGYARLRPGVGVERAEREANSFLGRLDQRFFGNSGRRFKLWELRAFVVRDVRTSLLVLLGAVALILLICCANLANLLLAKAGSRRKEIAVRVALGAGRGRVVRQLLTESVLLSTGGAALGLLLAYWGIKGMAKLAPANYPMLADAQLDATVLLFTAAIAIATGLIFGLAPALALSGAGVQEALKESGRGSGGSRGQSRFRGALVVAETALAASLAIGAGLLIRGFVHLRDTSPGFNPQGVLTAQCTLPAAKFAKPGQSVEVYRRLLAEAAAMPGVKAAGVVSVLPFSGSNTGTAILVEGRPAPRPEDLPTVWFRTADAGYFRAMEVPLLKGRLFTDLDSGKAPPVAIVNEVFAKRFWPGEDAVGKRFAFATSGEPRWISVIGVVGGIRHTALAQAPEAEFFTHYVQIPQNGMSLALRAASEPARLAPALRQAAQRADRDLTLSRVGAMTEVLENSTAPQRLTTLLLGVFAGMATLLAAIGIYGVVAFSAARRTQEIGIRMALGAARMDVFRLILGQGLRLAIAGLALGIALAFALSRVLRGTLAGMNLTDPAMFAGVPLLLAAVALLASYLPARRAAKLDPVVALRYE